MRPVPFRYLSVIFLLISFNAIAQQPGDCQNCVCAIPGLAGQTLWSVSSQPACDAVGSYTLDASKYGRIYGVPGRKYEIALCDTLHDTYVVVTTNNTSPLIIKCDDDGCGLPDGGSSVSFIPNASGIYRIYVFDGPCGTTFPTGSLFDLSIGCTTLSTPPNDLPCTATVLPINGSACSFTNGNTEGATNAQFSVPGIGGVPACGFAELQGGDVWYQLIVPASGYVGIRTQENSICAGAFQLYSATACNGTFTQIPGACVTVGTTGPSSEPEKTINAAAAGVAAGSTIYVRYWERNGNENGSFGICAFDPVLAANDGPCAPINLVLSTECQPIGFDADILSESAVAVPSCGNAGTVKDAWFSFQVPDPLPAGWPGLTVSTTGAAPIDLAIAWYRENNGTCEVNGLIEIACSATGEINSALVDPALLIAGETVHVRVWNEVPWNGPYEICAVLNQAPLNDDPCGAIELDLEYGCLMSMFTNLSATATGTTANGTSTGGIPVPTCGTPVQSDVWFKVIVPADGVVAVNTLAGTMTDAAIAFYKVASGSCANNNLNLQQLDCTTYGTSMPSDQLSGLVSGSTLYIRVWRQTGNNGEFGICAEQMGSPSGDCVYLLNMTDSNGDGWSGSEVSICLSGDCETYTLHGASASVEFGVDVGDQMTVSYTAVGVQQEEIAYSITYHGTSFFSSGSPPQTGMVLDQAMQCPLPPAPTSDCIGAIPLCSDVTFEPLYQPGNVPAELDAVSRGCLAAGEQQGVWMSLNFGPETPPCSPIAFYLDPLIDGYVDFAIWGPYPEGSHAGTICPISQAPYRCNWASGFGVKGLAYNNSLPASQGAGGGHFSRHMVVNPGDVFIMHAAGWAGVTPFEIVWTTPSPSFQVMASDCTGGNTPAPAGSRAELGCDVDVSAKVMLQGPYDSSTGLMKDDLRQLGLVPMIEPFSGLGYPQIGGGGNEATTQAIMNAGGSDAVVDWVRLELRDAVNTALIVAVAHGLLQRDGDIITSAGSPQFTFDLPPGNYHMAVRHRNHLGCMTAAPIAIGPNAPAVDLSSLSVATFGTDARRDVAGTAVLWSGNVDGDDRIQYIGSGNDRDPILQSIGGVLPTEVINGYHEEDVNLDGQVKYIGNANDRDPILMNIGGSDPTSIKIEQVP